MSAGRGKTWNPRKHGQILLVCSESSKQTQMPGIMPGKALPWAWCCAPALFLLGLEWCRAGSASLPGSELQSLLVFPLSHLGEGADKAGPRLRELSETLCACLELESPPGTFQGWILAPLGTNCDGPWQEKLPREGQANRNHLKYRFHTMDEG